VKSLMTSPRQFSVHVQTVLQIESRKSVSNLNQQERIITANICYEEEFKRRIHPDTSADERAWSTTQTSSKQVWNQATKADWISRRSGEPIPSRSGDHRSTNGVSNNPRDDRTGHPMEDA
jgi:hypothetical protein